MSPSSQSESQPLSIESLMQEALRKPGMLSLAAGFTDNSLMPRAEIAELCEAVLSAPDAGGEALQYGNPRGRPELREAVAERIRSLDHEWGADPGPIAPDDVLITNGSQQGLDLVVRACCRPGDAILVESPTYFVFLDLLRSLGVDPIPLPSRNDRLAVDELPRFFAELGRRRIADRVRGAYVMGYFANPTGYGHADTDKKKLVQALDAAGLTIPVIEDAAYREFWFGEPWPAPSYLSLELEGVPAIYLGTFTKTFATGMKVGYLVVRHPGLRHRIGTLKRVSDFGTSNFTQAILARALENGSYDRFLARMRPFYAEKARVLGGALAEEGLPGMGWSWERSRGGLYLWLSAPPGVQVGPGSRFYEACIEENVLYVPGSLCHPGGGDPREPGAIDGGPGGEVEGGVDRGGPGEGARRSGGGEGKIRLSYGNLDVEELAEAARRLARASAKVSAAGVAA